MIERRIERVACFAAALATTAIASGARADTIADAKLRCVGAYEKAQVARAAGHLTEAREAAIVCSQDVCAGSKKECSDWLTEVESSIPTVIFEARDRQGRDTASVEVFADGKPFVKRLDGGAKPIDPGEHAMRYELEGEPSREERLVIRQGEKGRRITISWAPVEGASPFWPPRGPRAYAMYGLAAIGLVGGAMFATFGLIGQHEYAHLAATCQHQCSEAKAAPVHAKLVAADVSLTVSVVSLGAATALFLTAGKRSPPSAWRFDATPMRRGAFVSAAHAF